MLTITRFLFAFIVTSSALTVSAAAPESMLKELDQRAAQYAQLAQSIWDKAELGYLETESSALLQDTLKAEGFSIDSAVADIPTAFVASYGSGAPVIALLAEFDALPGISQSAAAVREELADKSSGHACGHHLFGAGSTAAAIAIKNWLQEQDLPGTVRLYGTPAEEGGSGKVYLVRAGLFADVDAVLVWHPSDANAVNPATSLANKSAKFRFHGISSHAAVAPERGRSALDGVEAMNYMVNMMREHIPQESRIHYVISSGGSAPNVVPDFAEVFYYVRHPQAAQLELIWQRVMAAAEGAAQGTGTTMEAEVIHGNHSMLPNKTLATAMHRRLEQVGGVHYNAKEQAYAQQISSSLDQSQVLKGQEQQIEPMRLEQGMGSTDVGDVSWQVPTVEMRAATWVPGTAPHSWQAIAAGGTSIGHKGMMVAAKTMALTAADLYQQPALLQAAKEEFEQRRGKDFHYQALLGDREPPLDYRR
ncbi:amidohydrolase [Parahaliea sp. F7430]|uniref:Amidohydrolase n=1 Tax=Sediminihaliea albiluteola TaxID=2758564 RepID=A0A7W2TYA2_9GAMM|nr:amidohydrolase [Sediminihaliea albiluteola]MBA6414165.1 amidohydrolase [Sediminihaliea albiluteola]